MADKQTEPGVVQGINLRDNKLRYDVQLDSGSVLVVNHRLIVPEPKRQLPIGTRLDVLHTANGAISAVVLSRPDHVASDRTPEAARLPRGRPSRHGLASPAKYRKPSSRSNWSGCEFPFDEPPHWLTDFPEPPAAPALRSQAPATPSSSAPAWASPSWTGTAPLWESAPEEGPENDLDRPIECPDLTALFAEAGPVAQLLGDRYRPRDGQIRMAELVRKTLVDKRHAVLEAGTGIGKSFAYLAPVVWSGVRAVVSTSNKALMGQLWSKDLPDLQRIAPRPFTAALLKGRGNYLCNLRLEELLRQRQLPGLDEDVRLVERGLGDTPSGDCEPMGLSRDLQRRLTVTHRECGGTKCSKFGECFYEQAKVNAAQADVVVTNHALLCFNTLRSENRILPVRPVLIVDEAHELQRYAINALTQALEYETLGSFVNHPLARDAVPADYRQQAMEHNGAFFEAVLARRPDRWSERWALGDALQEGMALWNALQRIQSRLKVQQSGDEDQGKHDALVRFGEEVLQTVHVLAHPEPVTAIRYGEMNGDGRKRPVEALTVQCQPLEVAEDLQRALFAAWPRVISTSATLSVENDLTWYERRVGLAGVGDTVRATIESPFDYREHVLLYTPQGLEPVYGPGEDQYAIRLAGEVRRLVTASRGRAFVLCTSTRRMSQLFEALSPVLGFLCICQGQGLSRQELLDLFKASGEAVLFATKSFWEGVDVPGEALSLVILDKIPFVPYKDPVFVRQERLIRKRGGDPFDELQLANAILTLRQGAGRLIRSETDRGVIAILDSRINTAKYGPRIINSLPDARRVLRFEEVQRFFADQ